MSVDPYEAISYTGPFTPEHIILLRKQSICSVHNLAARRFSTKPVGKLANSRALHRIHECSTQARPSVVTERAKKKSFHHMRYVIVFLGGLAVGFMSLLRLSITVAILNMVNQTKIYLDEHPDGNPVEYFGDSYKEVGEFDWNNSQQQLIISYYMITYTLPQLLATKLALRLGVRRAIPLSLGLCAISCLLTPILAYQGWPFVMVLRLVNGLGASAILPVMVHLIELWMPLSESTLGLAIVQSVQAVLFTTSPLISGLLADIHWKWAFYAPALAALVFCLAWLVVVSDTPGDCRMISQQELDEICGCDEAMDQQRELDSSPSGNSATPALSPGPWTRALRIKSFYALTAVWIFYNSSFGSLSFLIPSYMRQVLKVPIMENGMLCFIIQSGCMLSVVWPQPILRLLGGRCKLSLTAARRLIMGLICLVAIITWLLVAIYHHHQVILLAINRIFHLSTDTIVTATIMSQYAHTGASSTVYSVINSIGSFSTVLFCMAGGKFLDISKQSVECWSWVFVAMSIMNFGTLLLYSTVISSDPVKFNSNDNAKSSNNNNSNDDNNAHNHITKVAGKSDRMSY